MKSERVNPHSSQPKKRNKHARVLALCQAPSLKKWREFCCAVRFSAVNPHIELILKLIPLEQFLGMVSSSSADNVNTRDALMFSWRMKVRVNQLGLPRE